LLQANQTDLAFAMTVAGFSETSRPKAWLARSTTERWVLAEKPVREWPISAPFASLREGRRNAAAEAVCREIGSVPQGEASRCAGPEAQADIAENGWNGAVQLRVDTEIRNDDAGDGDAELFSKPSGKRRTIVAEQEALRGIE
jgi:hypothetical protein